MIFIALMSTIAILSYPFQFMLSDRRDWRMPLRHGMGGAFIYTGIDHFLNAQTRYQPMIPDYLAAYDFGFVIVSGALEIMGGLGLIMPLWGWRFLRLPNLRPVAGVCLVMLLSVLVVANSHVAESNAAITGFGDSATYYALRPFFQPLIILWALIASEAVAPPRRGP